MFPLNNIFIQNLQSFGNDVTIVDVLRLDAIHKIVSGNKWFKLKYYLQEAINNNCTTIITFGGAYSNHIIATAFACENLNLRCIGIIRGEESTTLSHTLQQAKDYGMELQFVSREAFKNKSEIASKYSNDKAFVIEEGGYGELGAKGAADILKVTDISSYTHIICACGTGTMLAGIADAALPHQQVIGINVLKGYENINEDARQIMQSKKEFIVLNKYHFGGYAKHPQQLINWMNNLWRKENLPTDIVYTSKLLFAVNDLLSSEYFLPNSKILIIHSGGLQGNLSLPKGTLLF